MIWSYSGGYLIIVMSLTDKSAEQLEAVTMHRLIICLFVSVLYGCSNLNYIEPEFGDRARVRFVTNTTTAPTVLLVYGGADCSGREHEWMRLRNSDTWLEPVNRLGIPLGNFSYNEHAIQEVYVAANKPITAILWGAHQSGPDSIYSCGVPFTMMFQKDKDYEIMYSMVSKACHVNISEILQRKTSEIYKMQSGKYFREKIAIFYNETDKKSGCSKKIDRFNLEGVPKQDSFKIKFN